MSREEQTPRLMIAPQALFICSSHSPEHRHNNRTALRPGQASVFRTRKPNFCVRQRRCTTWTRSSYSPRRNTSNWQIARDFGSQPLRHLHGLRDRPARAPTLHCDGATRGRTLTRPIRRGPLDLGKILKIGVPLADALESAHAKEIVHRDLKPANIFVNARGQWLVSTFCYMTVGLFRESRRLTLVKGYGAANQPAAPHHFVSTSRLVSVTPPARSR
jgi:hypothetical protein